MKRIDIAALPQYSDNGAWLYALEFDGGLVKVGCSRTPRHRIGLLFDEAARERRVSMRGCYVVKLADDRRFAWERRMLERLSHAAPLPNCREWFSELPYVEAMRAVADTCDESFAYVKRSPEAQGAGA